MAIIICPKCRESFRVNGEVVGTTVECAACHTTFTATASSISLKPITSSTFGSTIFPSADKKIWALFFAMCVIIIIHTILLGVLFIQRRTTGNNASSIVSASQAIVPLPPGTPSELLLKYSEQGELSYVEAVLKQNPTLDVNRPRVAGNKTALYLACEKGYLDIVQFLLRHKADVAICRDDNDPLRPGGFSPLTIAAAQGHLNVVKVLLASGVDIESRDATDRTALYASVVNNRLSVVQFLCESKAKINIYRDYRNEKWTPLKAAAVNGHVESIKILLRCSKEIDLEMCDGTGQCTPLYHAVQANRPEVVEVLCKANAKVNIYCGYSTPLTKAAEEGYTEVVKALVKYGNKINLELQPPIRRPHTPLWYAATHNHPKTVEVLCNAGADVNYYYYDVLDKRTSLLSDVVNPEIIEILKKHGAKYR